MNCIKKDIQVRNRYQKEIDILIQRINILQLQEKEYKNLNSEIIFLSSTLYKKLENNEKTDKELNEKNKTLNDLNKNIIENKNIINKQNKELENIKIKIEEYNNRYSINKEKIESDIEKVEKEIEWIKKKKEESILEKLKIDKELEEYKNKIQNEKWQIVNNIKNNEILLQKQIKEIEENNNKIDNLKKDYDEINIEYQNLLENYLIKSK